MCCSLVTMSIQALTSALPSVGRLAHRHGGARDFGVEVGLRDGDILGTQRLLEQMAVDGSFEHFDAVAIDAFLGQFAERDLAIVDDRGDARHFAALFRIAVDFLHDGLPLQRFERVGADFAKLAVAHQLGQADLGPR